jgi:hypothetical protein
MRFALLALVALFSQQPGAGASLSGYVLETTTGRPIDGVEVTITGRGPDITAITAADGHFDFDSIPPGTQSIRLDKQGYISTGRKFARKSIDLAPGEHRTDFVLRLRGTGVLSGRLLGPDGNPVARADVTVFRFLYRDLQPEPAGVEAVASGSSDDRGAFRIVDVPAGEYFVQALPDARTTSVGAALYPGVRDFREAERVEVLPGREVRLRDLIMHLPSQGWIRLHTVNATGAPLGGLSIGGGPAGWRDVANGGFFTNTSMRLGTNSEPQGFPTYQVRPLLLGPFSFYMAMQTSAGNVAGYTKVDYSGADIDVDFVVSKLVGDIKGRVLLESSDGTTSPLVGAEIEFFGLDAQSAFSVKDGTFDIKGLLNGPYQFSGGYEMPKGYYVASVRESDRDLLKDRLIVTEKTPEVEVRVRADSGSLQGRVADNLDRPAEGALVALVPQSLLQDRKDRHDTYRIAHSGPDGSFELRDIIPGDYLIYSWSDAEEDRIVDPRVIEIYNGRGLPVRVERGGKLKMDLRILDE